MIARLKNRRGFTLVEVIVTIIVSSLLAVMLMQVMGGPTGRSYRPLAIFDEGLAVRTVMEKISSDYRNLIITHETPLVELQNRINNGGSAGGYWHNQPHAASIAVVENYCLDINRDDNATPGETNIFGTCEHRSDRDFILKVTIAIDGQSLTSLFTR